LRRLEQVLGLVFLVLGLQMVAGVRAAPGADVSCDGRTVPVDVLQSQMTVSGTWCRPTGGTANTIFVLVHGGTYNRSYWDFPYEPGTYSFARAMARSGYAAYAIDLLGTGKSSIPPSALVTSGVQASAIHQVIGYLRQTGFDGASFDRVLLSSHSLGGLPVMIEAATYRDPDGVMITGLTHRPDAASVALVTANTYPATLDPAFAGRPLDPGYLTTLPGSRYGLFHAPGVVDPNVVARDEATKDVFSPAQGADGFPFGLLLPATDSIDAPVLLAVGEGDRIMCAPLGTNCSSATTLLAQEAPQFGSAPCISAVVMPGVGHDLNLHPSAPVFQAKVVAWADALAAGQCPEGPA
jgi:pimeloyl-ACP methyl ester carboxylesterase